VTVNVLILNYYVASVVKLRWPWWCMDLQKMEDWQCNVRRQRRWHARVLDTISADWKDKDLSVVDCS